MNKEQILFVAAALLLALGLALDLAGWKTEETFQPPAENRTKQEVIKRQLELPMFGAEMPDTAFSVSGRDPFSRKTEVKPLPLATLPAPPLPPMQRVAPGPLPMPGFMNLRMLEEPLPAGAVTFEAPSETGGEEGDEGTDEGDEWERRRW